MVAIELIGDGETEKANTELTQKIIANSTKHGLILLACNFYSNMIRFLVPITKLLKKI
tara:strand:- start:9 stop:182 length:174 start_codon:yes stop_codon:yes gene_type:complete